MPLVWTYSPSRTMMEALSALLVALGFDVQEAPDGAEAAVFDLTAYDTPIPPAPSLPCLAIVRSADPAVVEEVGRLGYRGVLRPHDDRERLARSLRDLIAGPLTTEPWQQADPDELGHPQLTPRETQVLSLVMLGLPNKRIATRLGITERTIKFHVSSLMRKYRTRGRLGLLVKGRGELAN